MLGKLFARGAILSERPDEVMAVLFPASFRQSGRPRFREGKRCGNPAHPRDDSLPE